MQQLATAQGKLQRQRDEISALRLDDLCSLSISMGNLDLVKVKRPFMKSNVLMSSKVETAQTSGSQRSAIAFI